MIQESHTLDEIRRALAERNIELLLAFHDGAHFIEKPNAVMALCGFKSIGPSALVIAAADGESTLLVTPAWDTLRAADRCQGLTVAAGDNLGDLLASYFKPRAVSHTKIGAVGLGGMAWPIARQLTEMLGGAPATLDPIIFAATRRKTAAQIARARRAARIAEQGYQRLLQSARPGMSEDELALELRWFMKSQGAEDNFLMLCAGPHNLAVQPSSGRKLAAGDVILAEITPSYQGQLAQICRTAVLGPASAVLRSGYDLVVRSMRQGIAAAQPGATVADVCRAIDTVLEARGYGEFCHPPHIRRRGHGLGFGSNQPGDVSVDNRTVLETDMFFVVHPNQYLPETGYLLCGEPVLISAGGNEILSERIASLAEIAL